jgi:hypothetical protein
MQNVTHSLPSKTKDLLVLYKHYGKVLGCESTSTGIDFSAFSQSILLEKAYL